MALKKATAFEKTLVRDYLVEDPHSMWLIQTWRITLVLLLAGAVVTVGAPTSSTIKTGELPRESPQAQTGQHEITNPIANCASFVIAGEPHSASGATWTYRSHDLGVDYVLEGVLFLPAGTGPFPAVVISHGKGGTARGYSANIARSMVGWGLVVIATVYSHAPDAEDAGNMPDGDDGASEANVLRAHKTRDLLSCLGSVDMSRVAAHGHSMGAFVTGQLLGTFPDDFRVASHTAGGVSQGPNATKRDAAERIVTPYQLHHGDADIVVALFQDQTLDDILTNSGVAHELNIYHGFGHADIPFDDEMLDRVRAWYEAHGLFEPVAAARPIITSALVSGKNLFVYGQDFRGGALIMMNGEQQKTRNDEENPSTTLIAKKAGKRIAPGQIVRLQVRNPDGETSPEFSFARP